MLLDDEILGELLKQAGVETLELTIAEKIWGYLLELLTLIADIFEIDMEQILDKMAVDNQLITKYHQNERRIKCGLALMRNFSKVIFLVG